MRDDPQYPARDDVWSDDDSRVVGVLRTMTAADEQLEDLPPGLWERISGQLESSDQPTVIDGPPQLRVVGPTVDAHAGRRPPAHAAPPAARPVGDLRLDSPSNGHRPG